MLRRLSNVPEIEADAPLRGAISGAVGRTDEGRSVSFGGAFSTGTTAAGGEAFVGTDAGNAGVVVGLVGGPIEIAGIAGRDRGPPAPIWIGWVTTTAGAAAGAAAVGFAAGARAADAGEGRAGGCGAWTADRGAAGRGCDADGANTFSFCNSGCAEAAGCRSSFGGRCTGVTFSATRVGAGAASVSFLASRGKSFEKMLIANVQVKPKRNRMPSTECKRSVDRVHMAEPSATDHDRDCTARHDDECHTGPP
jgi:hypothetical protein